ncbi:hypothetical protein [Labilibacter marinus]|uniref:hypothetical protein n=1 Tax=Labilibacter marinus TaxID=1477105 RepID=UPI00094FEA19|nr:hypothetical protein [Labilibacter marinus]
MKSRYTIYIDPTVKVLYASYYIQGLYDYFGKDSVRFSAQAFKSLKKRNDHEIYDHYLAFVIYDGVEYSKYIVDFWDKTIVDEYAYDWCDVYAKINIHKDFVKDKSKLISIPPGFGIKIWNKIDTLKYCILNFLKSNRTPHIKFKRHYEDYMDQFERPLIASYEYKKDQLDKDEESYVFMIGRLWPHKNCLKTTNPMRLKFVQACKKLNVNFEGGFFAKTSHPDFETYKSFVFTKKMDVNTYLQKTKKSAIAFNTPAVHDCHGWKLGEYLAMGKAIVSTPLSNFLPTTDMVKFPLHVVKDEEVLEKELSFILKDDEYRHGLEHLAQDYYNNLAKPVKVIESILNYKNITHSS